MILKIPQSWLNTSFLYIFRAISEYMHYPSARIHVLAAVIGAFPRAAYCCWTLLTGVRQFCCDLFQLMSGTNAAVPDRFWVCEPINKRTVESSEMKWDENWVTVQQSRTYYLHDGDLSWKCNSSTGACQGVRKQLSVLLLLLQIHATSFFVYSYIITCTIVATKGLNWDQRIVLRVAVKYML